MEVPYHATDVTERELTGPTAVVTGGGSGIGRGIARELARAGARLVVVGRRIEPLMESCALIGEEGGEARALAADVTGRDWLSRLDEMAPEVDVLVHDAAPLAPRAELEIAEERDIEELVEVILLAAVRLTRHSLGGMKRRAFGRILHVGSMASTMGTVGLAAYSAAKASLIGLTRSVAAEAGRCGVTCNLLQLGLVETERIERLMSPETRRWLIEHTAVGRAGSVEEVGRAARFLASPEAGFITGACLEVSGGMGLGIYPLPGSGDGH